MQPSPMIELMQYPFAVPLVTLLYTAVHILPVNLTRLYIFRRYLRFAPLPIISGLLLLTGIEAVIQIEAITVFSRRIGLANNASDDAKAKNRLWFMVGKVW